MQNQGVRMWGYFAPKPIKPCKCCGRIPVVVLEEIRGYEPCCQVTLPHNPDCWVVPRLTHCDTIYRTDAEAIDNAISQWNDYMTKMEEVTS